MSEFLLDAPEVEEDTPSFKLEVARLDREDKAGVLSAEMRDGLENRTPAIDAKNKSIARNASLPTSVIESLSPGKIAALEKLPSVEQMLMDDAKLPGFLDAAQKSRVLPENPDLYEETKGFAGMWNDFTRPVRSAYKDVNGQEELGYLGLKALDSYRKTGVWPRGALEEAELVQRQLATTSADLGKASGWLQAIAKGPIQSGDMMMINEENIEEPLRRFAELTSEEGSSFRAAVEWMNEADVTNKLGTALYVIASAGTGGIKSPLVHGNVALEGFQLERGNAIVSLMQLVDDEGNYLDPEIIETASLAYGAAAMTVEYLWWLKQKAGLEDTLGGTKEALKKLVLGKALSALKNPTVKSAAVQAMKRLGVLVAGGYTEEAAQSTIESFVTLMAQKAHGKFKETDTFEEVMSHFFSWETFKQANEEGMHGALAGLGVGGGGVFTNFIGDTSVAIAAQRNREAFQGLADGIAPSELKKRGAGDTLATMLNLSGNDPTNKERVYFEPDEIEDVLNQAEVDTEEVYPGLGDEIAKARAEMRRVAIPAPDYAVKLSGSTLFNELNKIITFDPVEGVSFKRTQERDAEMAELTKGVLEGLETEDRTVFNKSGRVVRTQAVAQLAATGRMTAQEVAGQADAFEAVYVSAAASQTKKTGQLVTPEDILRQRPLTILGPDGSVPTDAQLMQAGRYRAASIMVDGVAYEGNTHADAYDAALAAGAFKFTEAKSLDDLDPDGTDDDAITRFFDDIGINTFVEEGFTDEDGDFVEREEAAIGRSEDQGFDVLNQPGNFEPRVEQVQEGFSVLPIGRVETEFAELVERVGTEGLTPEALSGITGAPSKRGVSAGDAARKFLASLPEERKKLKGKRGAAKDDAARAKVDKKLAALTEKAKKKRVDLAREKELSVADAGVKPRPFAELVGFIEQALAESGSQTDWYKSFGLGIRSIVGRPSMQEASILFGITSAQNSTRQNLKDTLRIMIIARQHNPLADPAAFKKAIMQRPKGKGIAVSAADVDNFIRMYESGTYQGGLKVSNYMNLIRDRANNVFSPYTVQDVHMARVMGYLSRDPGKTGALIDSAKMPSADAIRYSMYLTELLSQHFGLKPDATQALLWFHAKNHLSPKVKERELTNLEKLYVERENAKRPLSEVEGTIEEAMAFSFQEIAEFAELEKSGLNDPNKPLTQALSSGQRPHFRSSTKSDPYSNIDLNPEILEVARARAPRSTVSANPGQARGYGLPVDTPLSVLLDHEQRTLEAITDGDGQIKFLREAGIVHEVSRTLGTWDRLEPSMVLTLPGETLSTADFVARILGDALLQDASITAQPSWEGQEFAVSFGREDGSNLSEQEISDLYDKVNPDHSTEGLNFTVADNGASLDFRDGRYFEADNYTDSDLEAFYASISAALGDGYTAKTFGEKGNYHGSESYAGEGSRDRSEVWDRLGLTGRPDLQEAALRDLYGPAWQAYRDTVARLGFTPERTESPLGEPLQEVVLNQPAWHGGPNNHKGPFSTEYIGTGEGALAFGWGLYFSSSRRIAEFYRNSLTQPSVGIKPKNIEMPNGIRPTLRAQIVTSTNDAYAAVDYEAAPSAEAVLQHTKLRLDARLAEHQASVSAVRHFPESERAEITERIADETARIEDALAQFESLSESDITITVKKNEGQVFEVDIPEDSELMDWDADALEDPRLMSFLDTRRSVKEGKSIGDLVREGDEPVRVGQAYTFLANKSADILGGQEASEALLAAGIKGHKYAAAQTTGMDIDETNYVIYDDASIEILNKLYAESLEAGGAARASYWQTAQGAFIQLTKQSDPTSFGHELAHFYLDTINAMVADGLADKSMEKDLQTALDFMGITDMSQSKLPYADGRLAPNGKDVDKPHEVFARGFEKFMAEGIAPSRKTAGMFARFHRWAMATYKTVENIARSLGVELTPEIRGVYGRMIDADTAVEQIPRMNLFETKDEGGMTEAAWASYVEDADLIHVENQSKLVSPLFKALKRERMQERRDLRDALTEKYTQEVDNESPYTHMRILNEGDPSLNIKAEGGIKRSDIRALYADTPGRADFIIKQLGRSLVQVDEGEGHNLEDAVAVFGAGSSPKAFIERMAQATPRRQEIQNRVRADLASRDEFKDDAIMAEAEASVGGPELERHFRREIKALRALAQTDLTPATKRAVAEVGAPTAAASRARVEQARAELEAAQTGGNVEAIAEAQQALVVAEVASEVEKDARRAQGAAVRKIKEVEQSIDAHQIAMRARQVVWNRPAGDVASDRRQWAARVQKVHAQARKAVAGRDYLKTIQLMEEASLLASMITEADAVLDRQPKILDYGKTFDKESTRERMRAGGESTTLDLIDAILDKIDLRRSVPIDRALQGEERAAAIADRKARSTARRKASQETRDQFVKKLLEWQTWKSEMYEVPTLDLDVLSREGVTHWKDLTVSELEGVYASLKNMSHLAKGEAAAVRAAEKLRVKETSEQVVLAIGVRSGDRLARSTDEYDKNGALNRIRRFGEWVDAMHIKSPRLFRWMGGDDITTNPMLAIAEMWKNSASMETILYEQYSVAYKEIMDELRGNTLKYDELIEMPGVMKKKRTRISLVGFGLNVGTWSNYKKLRDGYGLNEGQMDAILQMIDDTEWAAIEKVWALTDSLWEPTRDNHYDLTGERVPKLEKREFVTKDGRVIKGGYVPMSYESKSDAFQQRLADNKDIMDMTNTYAGRPDLEGGWHQQRNDKYSAEVVLDMNIVGRHIREVLHELAWRKNLKFSWQVFHDKGVRAAIESQFGATYFDAIEHRMRAFAGSVADPNKNLKEATTWVGNRVTAYTAFALSGAWSTFIVQPAGLAIGIPHINPEEGTRRHSTMLLAQKLLQVSNPATFTETQKFIHERSPWMKVRSSNLDYSIKTATEALAGETGWIARGQRAGFRGIGFTDYLTSGPIWMARYEVIMERTGDQAEAVREADYAVDRSQGSGSIDSLAQIQDSGKGMKAFGMFYSFFSAYYSELHWMGERALNPNAKRGSKSQRAGDLAVDYILISIIPNMLADALKGNIPGDEDEDDKYWTDEFAWWVAESAILGPTQSMILVRDVAQAGWSKLTGRGFGRSGVELSPVTGAADAGWRMLSNMLDAVDPDEDFGWPEAVGLLESVNTAAGATLGIAGFRQSSQIMKNFKDYLETGEDLSIFDLFRRRKN